MREIEVDELKVSSHSAGPSIAKVCKSRATSPFDQKKVREALEHFTQPVGLENLEKNLARIQLNEEDTIQRLDNNSNIILDKKTNDATKFMQSYARVISLKSTTSSGDYLWRPDCTVAPISYNDDNFRQSVVFSQRFRNKSTHVYFVSDGALKMSEMNERYVKVLLYAMHRLIIIIHKQYYISPIALVGLRIFYSLKPRRQ